LRAISNLACHLPGFLDVPGLRRFVASAQQDDDCVPAPDEIDAITRAIVDPKFADAFKEFGVSQQTRFNTDNPLSDFPGGSDIGEIPQPFSEFIGRRTSIICKL